MNRFWFFEKVVHSLVWSRINQIFFFIPYCWIRGKAFQVQRVFIVLCVCEKLILRPVRELASFIPCPVSCTLLGHSLVYPLHES